MFKKFQYLFVCLFLGISSASAQPWAWSYTSYDNNNKPSGTGSIQLNRDNNQFTLEFMVPGIRSCYFGKLPAEVDLADNKININFTTSEQTQGCGKIRFSLSLDGTNGTRYTFLNNTPNQDKFDRQMVSKNPSELPKLIALLKSGGTQIAQAPAPMPAPVAATLNQPARSASIGNIQPATSAQQGSTNQATRLTTNPIDTQKKTSGNEIWVSFNPSITVQERQFCRIIENFRTENEIASPSDRPAAVR